jgi:hypothetical protein
MFWWRKGSRENVFGIVTILRGDVWEVIQFVVVARDFFLRQHVRTGLIERSIWWVPVAVRRRLCGRGVTLTTDAISAEVKNGWSWDLRSSGIVRSVEWQYFADISGQRIGPIFKRSSSGQRIGPIFKRSSSGQRIGPIFKRSSSGQRIGPIFKGQLRDPWRWDR